MSIFRKHKSIVDRAASDRSRHKKKIEKAIKDSIKDVIADAFLQQILTEFVLVP